MSTDTAHVLKTHVKYLTNSGLHKIFNNLVVNTLNTINITTIDNMKTVIAGLWY